MWNKGEKWKMSGTDIETRTQNIGTFILTFTQWYLLTSSTLEISVL